MDLKSVIAVLAISITPCVLAFNLGHRQQVSHKLFSALTGTIAIIALSVLVYLRHIEGSFQSAPPILLGVYPLSFRADGLSCLFLGLLSVLLLTVSLFSPGYLKHFQDRIHNGQYWATFLLFILSMFGVVLSADAITFLVLWEVMSLSSAGLVASDHSHHKVQKSTLIYLGATRIATALLSIGFLSMHSISGSWQFADWSFSQPSTYLPALLLLLAFCIKAGIWPFHIWLPYAHPAAPATVSALMSGFMIKIAMYCIIRILVCGGLNSVELANLALFLGSISAFWGVLFALVQNDLKRLLAYSSIENSGLILISIALCLKTRGAGLLSIAELSLLAAIFHCLNHGLFKSLLFLSAGSVDAQAHSRDLRKLGGLARLTPWTATCFILGSFAICSLPPLNGFASKWLLYQAVFKTACQTGLYLERGISLAILVLLSIVGGLAIATFAKASGVAFLGIPRSKPTANAKEASPGMLTAQGILASLSIAFGAFAPQVLALIAKYVANTPGIPVSQSYSLSLARATFPLPLGIVTLSLGVTSAVIYLLFMKPSAVRKYNTWDCGFGPLSARSQVTSDSFAQPVARIFRPILRYQTEVTISGQDRRHFPQRIKVDTKMVSLLETRLYLPVLALIGSSSRYLARLQAGSIHLYLLYLCATLVILLLVGTRL